MLDLGLLDLYLAAALALLAAGVYLAARAGALPARTPAVLLGALLAALGILAFQRRRRAALERRLEALRAEARARAERLEALRDEVQASEEEVAEANARLHDRIAATERELELIRARTEERRRRIRALPATRAFEEFRRAFGEGGAGERGSGPGRDEATDARSPR